jgi:hypothetical protein
VSALLEEGLREGRSAVQVPNACRDAQRWKNGRGSCVAVKIRSGRGRSVGEVDKQQTTTPERERERGRSTIGKAPFAQLKTSQRRLVLA